MLTKLAEPQILNGPVPGLNMEQICEFLCRTASFCKV
jgi:hypothetical protein